MSLLFYLGRVFSLARQPSVYAYPVCILRLLVEVRWSSLMCSAFPGSNDKSMSWTRIWYVGLETWAVGANFSGPIRAFLHHFLSFLACKLLLWPFDIFFALITSLSPIFSTSSSQESLAISFFSSLLCILSMVPASSNWLATFFPDLNYPLISAWLWEIATLMFLISCSIVTGWLFC